MRKSPTPEQIKQARQAAGLTQAQAAELIYSTRRTLQDWEYGKNPMHPAIWELFLIKTKPR
jgi:DNA-binding transcriptional regulator YiaG